MSVATVAEIHADLQEWLCRHLAAQLRLPVDTIDPAERMSAYGLDSLRVVAVLMDVEEHVGFAVDSDVLWDHPTIAEFSLFLARRVASES